MSNHVAYLDKSIKILKKYSLGGIVEGVPIATINELIKQHEQELISCDTFDKAMIMANRALCDVSGFPMKIESFISSRADLMILYDVFIEWRDSVVPLRA